MTAYALTFCVLASVLLVYGVVRQAVMFGVRQRLYAIRDRFNQFIVDDDVQLTPEQKQHLENLIAAILACVGRLGWISLSLSVWQANQRESEGRIRASELPLPAREVYSDCLSVLLFSVVVGSPLTAPLGAILIAILGIRQFNVWLTRWCSLLMSRDFNVSTSIALPRSLQYASTHRIWWSPSGTIV